MSGGSEPLEGPASRFRGRNPISRARFERVANRAIAGFGLIFGLQTVPAALAQLPVLRAPWGLVLVLVVFGGLLLMALAALGQRLVNRAANLVALTYFLALLAWPFVVADPGAALAGRPWLWYLCTVATACAAISLPVLWAAAYTVVVPFVYAAVRTLPAGGDVSVETAALDGSYAMILGGVLLVIFTMLRQATSSVDEAQATALERYATAVRQHATEQERVQVDAIVHDSVLTTLLSAAAASTPDAQARAAGMAEAAIGHLHAAEAADPDDQSMIRLDRLSERIRSSAAAFSAPFAIAVRSVSTQMLPVPVAEAVYSATVQAMVNSMQHAGGVDVPRMLTLTGTQRDGVVVEVSDAGAGFELAGVPTERLGLRVSIQERIASVGGEADIRSSLGEGTTVVVRWPARRAQGEEEA